jgi:hypothetical protein
MGSYESIDKQNELMENFNGYIKLLRSNFQQNKKKIYEGYYIMPNAIMELFVDCMKLFKKLNTRCKNETYYKFNAIRDLYLTYNIIGPKNKFDLGWTWKMQKSDAKRWANELKESKKELLARRTIKLAKEIITISGAIFKK